MSSCGIHNGLTSSLNNHATEVVLAKKNFTVVDKVKGEAQAMYVLGIGGLAKDALIAEARADMFSCVDIVGTSRAVINETVEVKRSFFPLVTTVKVVVSAHIIEFVE